jgi:hypothetical protein
MTTPHEWYVENRAAFVARALERDEERTFIEHLMGCDECAREVERLERDLAWLPMGAAPEMPRPGLTRELLERVAPSRRRATGWLVPLAAAAMLVLAAGLGAREELARRGLERELASARTTLAERTRRADALGAELAAVRDTMSVLQGAAHVIQTRLDMHGHEGGLLIFQDVSTHRWCVVMHGLPPAPPGEVYQFWFITGSGMVRSVALRMEDARPAFATVPMPGVAAPVMGAALTVEPVSAPAPEPKGPMLAHLLF